MARYAPLLLISVAHAYFADRRCRGLRFTPCAGTAAWLREVDALTREIGSVLLVLGGVERLARASAPPGGLAWTLHCDDARFAAVTAGLPVPGEQLMSFVGSQVLAPADDGSQRLHAGATAGSGDVWPLVWPAISSQLGAAQRKPAPLALLQVHAPTPAPPMGAPVRYEATFAARAPVWKYCLVGAWSSDALEVVASTGEPLFGAPVAETLHDGQPVLAFRSTTGIELRERNERRFKLRTAAAKRVLVERLPVAGADHFARETIHGVPTLVSEIHVHR